MVVDEKTLRTVAALTEALNRIAGERNADWPDELRVEVKLRYAGEPLGAFTDEYGDWMFEFFTEAVSDDGLP